MADTPDDYIIRGNNHLKKGDIDSAIRAYSDAIQLKPDYAEAYYSRGNAFDAEGKPEKAMRDYDKAISLKPTFSSTFANRGALRFRRGEYQEALQDFDKSIQLDPDNADAYNNRGGTHLQIVSLDAAIRDFHKAIMLKPDSAAAYNNRGLAKKKQGDIKGALQDFDKAIELKPDFDDAYNNRRGIFITDKYVSDGAKYLNIEKQLCDYFKCLDDNLDTLSKKKEGYLSKLPAWAQSARRITIGFTENKEVIIVKVTQDYNLDQDEIALVKVENESDLYKITAPARITYDLKRIRRESQISFPSVLIQSANPFAEPVLNEDSLTFLGGDIGFLAYFNEISAQEDAVNMWNACSSEENIEPKSYVFHVNNILSRLSVLIKRGAFPERRIHRFINTHRRLLLPTYKKCHFEHDLYLKEDRRTADFILEKEQGLPPLLIELESTQHNVFKQNGDLTFQVNHAIDQIAEWVKFIEEDAQTNAVDEFSFLTGPKDRLVIIGQGLEHRSKLIDTKHRGTVVWTYDIFIEEARNRLNNSHAANCRLVGMPAIKPF